MPNIFLSKTINDSSNKWLKTNFFPSGERKWGYWHEISTAPQEWKLGLEMVCNPDFFDFFRNRYTFYIWVFEWIKYAFFAWHAQKLCKHIQNRFYLLSFSFTKTRQVIFLDFFFRIYNLEFNGNVYIVRPGEGCRFLFG